MKWITSRILWGSLLILGGILFLLDSLEILKVGGLFWAAVFGLGGLFFVSIFLNNRANWWALIPAVILLDIALMITLGILVPGFEGNWGGALFLAGIGLTFWVVYLIDHGQWWAIIPGGVLLTLAIVAGISTMGEGLETGGVFFLGIGITFGLLGILPTGGAHLQWAFIPAAVLILMGVVLAATAYSFLNYLWPILLIIGGLYLIYLTTRSKRAS